MKASKILRRAAVIAEETVSGACRGIFLAYGEDRYWDAKDRAKNLIRSLYEADGDGTYYFGLPWSTGPSAWAMSPNLENQNHRIIAMLLAADILESEGD